MFEKIIILAIVPTVALLIFLGWAWLITTGKKSTSITLHGFGIKVEVCSEEWKTSTNRKDQL